MPLMVSRACWSGGGGGTVCDIRPQSPGKITHFSNVLMVRHLVQSAVTIYGSYFGLFKILNLKNHIKEKFQQRYLKQFLKKTKSFMFICLFLIF
jgi:hypothetical protein